MFHGKTELKFVSSVPWKSYVSFTEHCYISGYMEQRKPVAI